MRDLWSLRLAVQVLLLADLVFGECLGLGCRGPLVLASRGCSSVVFRMSLEVLGFGNYGAG